MGSESVRDEMGRRFGVFDHSPIGQFVVWKDFSVIFWNRCMEAWTGISRDEILGTDLLFHYPFLAEARYADRIRAAFKGGPPIVFSAQLHRHIIPAPLPGKDKFRVQYTVVTTMPVPATEDYCAIFSIQDVTSLTEALDRNKLMLRQVVEEVNERRLAESQLAETVKELQRALAEINTLRGIIPICSSCKQIRDDKGYWSQIEAYISKHSEARFSHGICPDCANRLYPGFTAYTKDK